MDVDWWHEITVAILSLALAFEGIGAYCAQKERLSEWRGLIQDVQWREGLGKFKSWAHLWLKRVERESSPNVFDVEYRLQWLDPEIGPVFRGVGRLSVAVIFLARFAAGQPPPFLGS